MTETPTQQLLASQPEAVKLEGDITVRVLSPIEQFRFKKVVGKYVDNPGYMLDAMMAASVREVGGEPMPFPQNEQGIELILGKLGWKGWQSVQDHYVALGTETADEVETAKNS